MKQTAVEWLESKMTDYLKSLYKSEIEQAKEMEKQQIIDAYIEGYSATDFNVDSEQYYNETFGK
jgi:hypothetical protein